MPSKLHGRGTSARLLRVASILLCLSLLPLPSGAQKKEKLAKNYRQWLEEDVVYIITKEERQTFLKLTTDEARDKFIKDFWEIRNPTPGAEINTYKEEFYQRIAFANSRFGPGSNSEGWRTDRGRTYITLGPPQQKQIMRNQANLRPLEIWFYANNNPALPQSFYVIFYDRDGTGDYRYYSPYLDGPDKLVTGVEAINDNAGALKMIIDSVGGELAHLSLSLIPGEPVDLSDPRPSLQSDIMLMTVRGLSEQPSYKDDIHRKWMNREQVNTSMILQGRNLDVILFPARDDHGLTRLDYCVRLKTPTDLSVSETKDLRVAYSLQVRAQVFNADTEKLIFINQKDVRDVLDKSQFEGLKSKVFSYEGMLPLPPGHYRIAFQFTDWNKSVAYRTERDVTILKPERGKFDIAGVLPFYSAEQVDSIAARVLPFTLAGVHFTPMSTNDLLISADQKLQLAYQIWTDPKDLAAHQDQSLAIEYGVGQPSIPGSAKTVKESVAMNQFDPGGSIVSGQRLTPGENPGNYIVTLAVNPSNSQVQSFAKLNFKVVDPAALRPEPWVVVDSTIRDDLEGGVFDQQRGLCYLSQGSNSEARGWLLRALRANHGNEVARARLVDAYYSQKDYNAVAALYKDTGVTESADSGTLLRIATSLRMLGKENEGLSLIQHGVDLHPQDPSMYLALSDYFTQTGDKEKAAAAIQKSRSLASQN